MGYYSSFEGQFKLNKPLSPEHREYLQKFAETRRMRRDNTKLEAIPDPVREKVKLPLGEEGAYFIGETDKAPETEGNPFGYAYKDSILDHNEAPGTPKDISKDFQTNWDNRQKYIDAGKCQPGLWCEWMPNADGTEITGPEEESKFYYSWAWLKYIVKHFLEPWGYKITGTVTREGEEQGDVEKYIAKDNKLTRKAGKITFN
jgi:hypothetical protein